MEYPRDPYQQIQYNMVRAHNVFKEGYKNIIFHLENPPKDDLKNFIGYCRAWGSAIMSHHGTEETIVFPFLNTKLDFHAEIEQHEHIHKALSEFVTYLDEAAKQPSNFDPSRVQTMMENMYDILVTHLDEEVAHLSPEFLEVFTTEELLQLDKKLQSYAVKHDDPFVILPFMKSHLPQEYKDIWPPLPWVVRRLAIPYIFALKYYGYWKYSAYAMY